MIKELICFIMILKCKVTVSKIIIFAAMWHYVAAYVKYGVSSTKSPVYSCTQTRPPPPPPPHLGSYTRALLVSQNRRHLFVTPCVSTSLAHSSIISKEFCMFFTQSCLFLYLGRTYPSLSTRG